MAADDLKDKPELDIAAVRKRKLPLSAKARVYYHRARASLRRPWWWVTFLFVLAFWVLVGWPVYEKSIGHGLAHTGLAILLVFGRAWRQVASSNMKLVSAEYLTRKSRLYSLIAQLRMPQMSAREVEAFQRECLGLIASYVRGHRADASGNEIFVNLLVEDGPDLVVVARNHDHRKPGARYPKHELFAWLALKNGETVATPDIFFDRPDTSRDKPYRSILAIPIMGKGSVLGVVSIDSKRTYHFDLEREELERYLAPYVCLLGRSLTEAVI